MQRISAVVITYNERENIRACLESLKWVDEIIVVDSFSTDNTIQIANLYTDKVFQREWQGYSKQKNFGLSKTNIEWILFLDADERISGTLAYEIKEVIKNNYSIYSGYYMPRQCFYLGRWIKYGEWSPDFKLRLVKKEKGIWSGSSVHEKLILDGKAGYLRSPMYHYSYCNINHHLEKFNLYSSLFAKEAYKRGEKFRFYKLLWAPFIRFIKGYFLKQGFRDGFAGLVIAFMQSFEVFLRYAKLWELEKNLD